MSELPPDVPPSRAERHASLWTECAIAIVYLTRLPFVSRLLPESEEERSKLSARSLTWFPLVGALIGLFGGAVDALASFMGLPPYVVAPMTLICMLWLTGAVHENGLAGLVNYLSRLPGAVPKDLVNESQNLAYGNIAVLMGLAIRAAALATLSESETVFAALIVAGAWSRAVMAPVAAWLGPDPNDAFAARFGRPSGLRVVMSLALGLMISFSVLQSTCGPVIGAATIVALALALAASRFQSHRYNGPLLNSIQQLTELTALLMIVIMQGIAVN
ncbi:MAG: adenosylcobinamide-GDP ribazoletransferase [Alphaproteobacteria bacterium]|nr:MAG: adenosylcobinamide-GDP ribazoletransferase [Alphaproteobacteria bacterium]